MTDLIDDSKKIGIYDIGEKWIDIGHIDDFKKANVQLKKW
jgi:NDP-sugar pyrophosphorylase family protein